MHTIPLTHIHTQTILRISYDSDSVEPDVNLIRYLETNPYWVISIISAIGYIDFELPQFRLA